MGEGSVSWGQPRLQSQKGGPQRSRILGALFYLYLHPLTENDRFRRGNTCGMGWFLGQTRRPSQGGVHTPADPNFGGSHTVAYTV